MPLTSVEPRRLYRQIAEQLRALIDRGEFPAGTRLPTERDLAAQLGVSRPTVREALIALEVDGRIRIRVGSGIYVLDAPKSGGLPTAASSGPLELLEARALIEAAVAESAAERVRPADIVTLDGILAEMRRASHPGPDSVGIDRAFHRAIASIAGNDAITETVTHLFDQRGGPLFQGLARHFENAESWQATLEEHLVIRNALRRKDGAAARSAMKQHLDNARLRFSRTFSAALAETTAAGQRLPTRSSAAEKVVITKRRKAP